ncbi:hypothetical protein ACQVPJ_24355 [Bacillus mycoides]|uniref:hypothetical protein n=1 Tax=Bacillus cereus group TaxID=86661 RepID=UPI00039DE77D|nr:MULTISPECIES: hypothetical protein [Bacillus cereus group]MCQ6569294.1 hypothetical protein [Bacillus mycoides]
MGLTSVGHATTTFAAEVQEQKKTYFHKQWSVCADGKEVFSFFETTIENIKLNVDTSGYKEDYLTFKVGGNPLTASKKIPRE